MNRSNRKIHLDFHTPHWVKQVGQNYDPETLVKTWKDADVNAVTVVFGLCACGNAYYETDSAPVHPGLQTDMLQSLLPIAHREAIEIFVHFGPGINDRSVIEHPEWAMRSKDGISYDTHDGREWGWVCYNSPYMEQWFYPQLRDFVQRFPDVAGIFVDMVTFPEDTCYCENCRSKAAKLGMDISHQEGMDRFLDASLDEFMRKAQNIVKTNNPSMLFTCNTRWFVGGARHETLDFIELEAPITWNSHHFPIMSRYLRAIPKPSGGMTTRFPFNWGYFGGLNTVSQLIFECAEIMATLGACCIGDQLHPSGRPEEGVYELIGQVYEYVAKREPWTLDAKTVPYIGLLADDQRNIWLHAAEPGYFSPMQKPAAFYGGGLTLLEGSRQFDVLDRMSDIDAYSLLWLAENVTLDESLIPKLEKFVYDGGRLVVSGTGLWNRPEWRTLLEKMGNVQYSGIREGGTYLRPAELTAYDGVAQIPLFVKGNSVVWEPLAHSVSSQRIFAETYGTYENIPITRKFSHFHPPSDEQIPEPGIVISGFGDGQVALISAPVAEYYFRSGSPHIRQLLLGLMDAILPSERRIVELETPSSAVEISLTTQPGRWNLHLIQYAPKRHTGTNVIEDVPIRHNIVIRLRPPFPPKRIYSAPTGDPISWTEETDGLVRFIVPELRIHEMIVTEWEI